MEKEATKIKDDVNMKETQINGAEKPLKVDEKNGLQSGKMKYRSLGFYILIYMVIALLSLFAKLDGLYALLVLFSIATLFLGLIKPSFVKMDSRVKAFIVFFPITFLLFYFIPNKQNDSPSIIYLLSALLFLFSIIALIFGLIKPSLIKMDSRVKVLQIFFVVAVFLFAIIAITAPELSPEQKAAEQVRIQEKQAVDQIKQVAEQAKTEQEKTELTKANKNLTDFLVKGIEAGLIKDVKTNDVSRTIYVSDIWLITPVSDKENFLTYAFSLMKKATREGSLEIKHYQSNELLGEISGWSMNVYK